MWACSTKSALILCASLVASAAWAGNWNVQTHDIYAGRFNNDNRTDLLVIAKDSGSFSGLFVTDATGNPSIEYQSWDSNFLGIDWSGGNYSVIVGNFDGVRGDDVFLQGSGDGSSYLLLSGADGRLTTIDQTLSGWSTNLYRAVSGDFNGDGRNDIFLQARRPSGTNHVVTTDAAGHLVTTADSWGNTHLGFRWSVQDALVFAGDFNGDSRDDLLIQAKPRIVLIDYDIPIPVPVFDSQAFGLVLANSAGQFPSIHQLWNRNELGVDWSSSSADLLTGDFNGDGRDDVMLVGRTAGRSSYGVLANSNGQLTSVPSQVLNPGTSGTNWTANEYRFVAGDFNGDGRAELYRQAVSASDTNSSVSFTSGGTVAAVTNLSAPAITGSAMTHSKTDVIEYHDNMAHWVVGQVGSVSTNGIEASRTEYDANAQPHQHYAFGKLQAAYAYLSSGLLHTATDGNNHAMTFENYKRGIPQLVRFADNTTRSITVDDNGWIADITDEAGAKTCYGYDFMGRLESRTYPSESQSGICNASTWTPQTIAYMQLTSAQLGMPAGTWRQRLTQGRIRMTQYFDAFFRVALVEEMDTASGTVTYRRNSYNHAGQMTFESYPASSHLANAGIEATYDALGYLQTRRTTDDIDLETVVYLTGNRKQVTDADGKTTVTRFQQFDAPDEASTVHIQAPENQTTAIRRDAFGKVLTITQSGAWSGGFASATRKFEYDRHHRPCRRTDPERGSTVWGYDAGDRRVWEAKGQSGSGCLTSAPSGATQYGYDARNRKTLDDYPASNEDISYDYDPAGNLETIANATAVWTYAYNKRNLLESEQVVVDGRTRAFDPVYDSLGHLASLTTPAHVITYAPDAWGRPTQVGPYLAGIQYHPSGLPSSYTLGNGLTYSQTLDNRLRPSLQDTRNGGTSIQKFLYGYSNANQLLSIDDQVNDTDDLTATYDNLHRLKTAAGLWGNYTYTYDTLNNIRTRAAGSSSLTYSYDGQNRLTSISGNQSRTYGYNARGEVTGDGLKTFTLNSQGQISAITGLTTYGYDGNAKRIKTVKSGVTEYTMYSSAGAMMFVEKGAAMTDHLALGGQTLVELRKTGGVSTPTYLHPDLLGSPRAATNTAKTVLWRETYDPFGLKLNGVNDKVGYTGHAHDQESGYAYMQARFYDPVTGRFLSADPVDDDFNLYAYVGNDPLNQFDPTGMYSCGKSLDAGQCETFTKAQDTAKQQITSAVGTLSGIQSKVNSGDSLSSGEQKVADGVSKVLGKGAGTDSKVLGALIDNGNKMLAKLNSDMPAEFGGDHASRLAEAPGNQLTLHSGFFRQTPNGQAQITAHESHHHGVGGLDIELRRGSERISPYGYPAAVRRAEILKNPMRSLRIPDPTTYALGFQDEILP